MLTSNDIISLVSFPEMLRLIDLLLPSEDSQTVPILKHALVGIVWLLQRYPPESCITPRPRRNHHTIEAWAWQHRSPNTSSFWNTSNHFWQKTPTQSNVATRRKQIEKGASFNLMSMAQSTGGNNNGTGAKSHLQAGGQNSGNDSNLCHGNQRLRPSSPMM